MKTIIKKSTSILLVFCMLMSFLTVQITALASGDNVPSDLEYIHSSAVPNDKNNLFSTGKDLNEVTEKKEGYGYVYVGSNVLSNYIVASVFTEKQASYPNETPMYTDANGVSYYAGSALKNFTSRKLMVNGLYLNGTYVEGKFPARYDYVQQFTLQDSETKKLITAYCADQITPTQKAYFYNIENVQDATYYTKDQAEMIRSIVLNGYWGTPSGVGSIENIKKMMRDSKKFTDEEINALTDGIALSATQFAIWNFSNAMSGIKVVNTYWTTKVMNAYTSSVEPDKAAVDLLFKLYNHLINLDPTPAENTTADTIINKNNFIKNLEIIPYQTIKDHPNNLDNDKTNDVFNCTLSFTMEVLPSNLRGDSLTAEIIDANGNVIAVGRIVGNLKPGEIKLVEKGAGRYMFEDLPLQEGEQNLNVRIVGEQILTQNAYLYTSELRDELTSQTLVGIANGKHDVDVTLNYKVEFNVQDELDGTKESLFVDCKTDRFEVTVEVPGGDAEIEHDEVILMVDGSYSMDEEWEDMKETILAIGETVLDGSGHTQLTLMSFGISPNVVLEHVTTVQELAEKLPGKPGGLLYGRSATNCDGAFEGIQWYLDEHDDTLGEVNVIFLSDGGANLNSEKVDWIGVAENASAGNAYGAHTEELEAIVFGWETISDVTKALYGDDLDDLLANWEKVTEYKYEIKALNAEKTTLQNELKAIKDKTSEEYITKNARIQEINNLVAEAEAKRAPYLAAANAYINETNELGKTKAQQWILQIYKDFYKFAGLTEGVEYPVYIAEYAYVDYEKATGYYLFNTFYYLLGASGIATDTIKIDKVDHKGYYAAIEAAKCAQHEKIDNLYIVRYGNDHRSNWMTKVPNSTFIQSTSVSTLTEALKETLETLSKTPYNNVVVTDYMSKWVNLDPTSIKIVDTDTGIVIWTAKDGWLVEEDLRPTKKDLPVIVELVPESEYANGGEHVLGNTSGVIYKLTWFLKDGALLRSDSYQLKYEVTADVEEEGFEFGENYPANGTTKITYTDNYGVEREKPIDVPDIHIKRPESVEVVIEGIKNLDGVPAKGYKFELVQNGKVIAVAESDENGRFSFEPMMFDIESTHRFTVNEVATDDEGIVFDTTIYTVNLSIERECGKYVAYVTYEKNDAEYDGKIIFNNKTTVPAEVTIDGEKLFDGEKADGFEFVLVQNGETIDSAVCENGRFQFKTLRFEKSGTYIYNVKEVLGDDECIVYDETVYTVVVTVARVGEEFKADVKYIKNGTPVNSIIFANKTTESAHAVIEGQKYFDGKLTAGYSFELLADGKVIDTATSDANGSFCFNELTFDKSGVYGYIVKEVTDNNANIVYDMAEYIVIISVSRVGDSFEATVEYILGNEKVDAIVFNNKTTTPAEVVLSGNKYFNGRPAADYEFALVQNGEIIETVKSDENGKFAFEKLTFNSIDRFEYQICEIEGDDINVVYDKVLYTAVIVVTREGDKFVANVSYQKDNEKYDGSLDFNNRPVAPTEIVLGGKKFFDGAAVSGYKFALAQNGEVIDIATSGEDGTFSFAKIDYTLVGEYEYTVYEIVENDETVVYDETVYTVKVSVTREGNALRVGVSTPAEIIFNNKTTTPATVVLDGEKYLDGILTDGFEFVLMQGDRAIETVTSENGKFTFGALTFDKSGVYEYTIKEVLGNDEKIVYDEKEIKVTVTVTREGDKFVANVEKSEAIVFNNKTTTPAEVTLGGVKYFDGILADGFKFVLMQGDRAIETVESKNGKYTFSALTFDSTGKYEYVIKEVIDDNEQIVYDEKEIEVVITVTKDGEKFVAAVESSEEIIFNNKTTAPAKVILEGEKYFDGELADGFEFVLMQGDRAISTATSENGKFSFNELSYDKSGKYEYVIKEVLGDEEYIVYDEKEIKVTVTVTREGDKFVAAIETSEAIVFNNKTVSSTEITLEGEKYLDGELADGFEFVLMQGDRVIETVGSQNGKFTFSALEFDRSGEYEYVIKEVLGDDEQIVYDEKEIKVVVTVIREGEDYVATVKTSEAIVFNNKTTSSTEVTLGGEKYLDGTLAGGFEFAIMQNGEILETVTSDEFGKYTFSAITFDRSGKYEYVIKEVIGNDDQIVYDAKEIDVVITVTRDGDKFVAAVESSEEIIFNNKTVEPAEVTLEGDKYLDGELAGGFEFALMDGETVIETVTSDEFGRFVFKTLVFDKAGEYKYTVVEVKGNDETIEYDETVFEITVTVTREGDKLVAAVEGADAIEFYNSILEDIPEESTPLAPPATGDKSITALLIMTITSALIGILTAMRRRRDIQI